MTGELNERERTVLHYVVRDFIETATPVGSRYISKRHEDILGLSSASIRNVMSDLEYLGYINHPHTSAGRVPTDLGYRFYLDALMQMDALTETERESIRGALTSREAEDELLRESSRLIGKISRQLCVISSPRLASGTLERIELVPLSGPRVLVVIAIKAGLVRTMMLEVASEIAREKLEEIARRLNERLAGLTIEEIRTSFAERLKDAAGDDTGLIRLFIDSVGKILPPARSEKIHIAGAESIIDQPEFENPAEFRGVIELINDEEIIIHVLAKHEALPPGVRVAVGEENRERKLASYSVITTSYTAGEVTGTIGLIGPRRMNYARVIPLVDYVARTISEMFGTTGRQ
ncbi:MAG TPA: heat-inducible transcriptional repressor HrcA [Bacteroidota bacterium]|nr:heat-inducible transcriptional repressor HrcA [Bacteroidota bacterium]